MRDILDRYRDARGRRYRRLRLRHGDYDRVSDLLPHEGLIVDLGAGAGLLAHVLVDASPGRRVLAVDHDPARVAALAESAVGLPIEVREADLATFTPPPCRAVVLLDVLHYFDGSAQERILATAAGALEEDGVLLLRDPDADGGLRFAVARLHERVAIRTGLTRATIGRYRSGHEWAALLECFGLRAVLEPLPRWSPYANRLVVGRRTRVR